MSDTHPPDHMTAPWMQRIRSGSFFAIVVIFVVLGALVGLGLTAAPDNAAAKYFHSIEGSPSLDVAMVAIATFGDATVLVVVGIILTIIRRTRKAGMVFLIAIVVIAIAVMYIKPLVGREVPKYVYEPSIKLPKGAIESDSLDPAAANFSFPSGHAARATSLAFIIGYAIYKRSQFLAYALWAFPVIIGITRLYLLQHYPTDIAGGILFGLVVSIALSSVMKLEQPFNILRFKTSDGKAKSPS